ncbi:MAG: hypothetical protein B9S32_16020 [Verrucomicrobia bacterium Tous-C9LFEB]|nr:MAG: hypothetical protein B9S32_16020 [Verrucomicrobia bacterium Tous-C9LFEB]
MALLSCLLFLGLASGAIAQNMVVYDEALQNGWQPFGWATINYANASPVHSGSTSISVTDSTTTAQALYIHHLAFPSTPYQSLTFWIYPTTAGTNRLKVQATLTLQAQTPVYLSFTAGQINQWQQITIPLSNLGVGDKTTFDGFWIQNVSGSPTTFYVDDIALVYAPPPNPVLATVDAQSVIRTIDERINGINLSMWDYNVGDPSTTALLQEMDIRMLRIPGGSNSDKYEWQTGQTETNFQWGTHADTFARIVEARGVQTYVTVNYGSGTPEQAAAWVAYYNGSTTSSQALGTDSKGRNWHTVGYWASLRAAAPLAVDDGKNFLRMSHPAPFGFKYWEIGNECYGTWETDLHGVEGSGLTGLQHDPYTYAQYFQSFYNQMRAVDPTLRIGAVISLGEDADGIGTHAVPNPNDNNSLHTGWTPVMLATLKSQGIAPHFLIYHYYAQYPNQESDAILLQVGGVIESHATLIRKMVTDYYDGTQGAAIELAVTEMNSVTNNPGKQVSSLVNALFRADVHGHFARTEFNACTWWSFRDGGNTTFNNGSALYGWRPYGEYGAVALGNLPEAPVNTKMPTFYAHKLLKYWGRGGDRVVTATSSYGLVGIHAAKLANGNLALLAINKHPTDDMTVQVVLNHFTPGSTNATVISYGKQNDLSLTDLSTSTASIPSGTFTTSVPSYSMQVMIIPSQFSAWREQKFTPTQLSDWSISGDTAQPAHDGVPNLAKYALGLDPNTPATTGLPVIGKVALNGKSYLTLTYTRPPGLADIVYTVQVSGDLQTWSSGASAVVRVDDGTTNTIVYRDLTPVSDASQRFMRLSVARP